MIIKLAFPFSQLEVVDHLDYSYKLIFTKIIKVKLNIEKQIEANDLIAKLQEVENEISSRN